MVKQIGGGNEGDRQSAEETAKDMLQSMLAVRPKPIRKDKFCKLLSTDGLNCPLCLELLVRPMVMKCGHTFCLPCIDECFLRNTAKQEWLVCMVCRKALKFYDYYESESLRGMVAQFIRKRATEKERQRYQERMDQLEKSEASRNFIILRNNQLVDFFHEEAMQWGSGVIMQVDFRTRFDHDICDVAYETLITVQIEGICLGRRSTKVWVVSQGSRKMASHRYFNKTGAIPTIPSYI